MIDSCLTPLDLATHFLTRGMGDPVCSIALDSAPAAPSFEAGSYLVVFALTCALEFPFYLAALRSWRKGALAALALNLATHPVIVFAMPWLVSRLEGTSAESLLCSELFAPLVEAILL